MKNKYTLEQFVSREKLITLLPHKSKMFLLDHLTQHDTATRTIEAHALIAKQNIFFDEDLDGVPSYVAFEFIAQCISALSGIIGYEKGRPPRPGFLLSLVNYTANVPVFRAGTWVRIKIKKIEEMNDILTYFGKVFLDKEETCVVSATLTAMETDDFNVLKTK